MRNASRAEGEASGAPRRGRLYSTGVVRLSLSSRKLAPWRWVCRGMCNGFAIR
jgi:hypothetical protein